MILMREQRIFFCGDLSVTKHLSSIAFFWINPLTKKQNSAIVCLILINIMTIWKHGYPFRIDRVFFQLHFPFSGFLFVMKNNTAEHDSVKSESSVGLIFPDYSTAICRL
jgi:hypothetical protein